MARVVIQSASFADYKYQCENVDFHMKKSNTAYYAKDIFKSYFKKL